MKYYVLATTILLPSLLSSQAIDKSSNYINEAGFNSGIYFNSSGLKEELLKKHFGDKLDTYYVPTYLYAPIYGNKIPLIMNNIPRYYYPSDAQIACQRWFLAKTKKLVDCLVFFNLGQFEAMKQIDPENNYFSELNKPGSDTSLTPGLALIKNISCEFKKICGLTDGGYEEACRMEEKHLTMLGLLLEMMPFLDVGRYTDNYSLKCREEDLEYRLYKSKHIPLVQPFHYLEKWFKDPEKKYFTQVQSAEIKALLEELYNKASQQMIAHHFSVGREPLVRRGEFKEFKVAATYADCVLK